MLFTFPPARIPAELQGLRLDVRAFLAEQRRRGLYEPQCSGWMVFDRAFSLECGRKGLIGMTWPKRYGGGERSMLERYTVLEELLAAGAPVGAHWIADRQSGPQILRFGSEELRRDLLPRICAGEAAFAIGMSEPEAGSDLANIRSRARPVKGGWRLDGRKIWTTNGHRADYLIGLFRSEDRNSEARHAGMTQFVVDLAAAGIRATSHRRPPRRGRFLRNHAG